MRGPYSCDDSNNIVDLLVRGSWTSQIRIVAKEDVRNVAPAELSDDTGEDRSTVLGL